MGARYLLFLIIMTGGVLAIDASDYPDDIMRAAIWTPNPDYPYEARFYHIEGGGVFVVRLHTSTGQVTEVRIARSTGNAMLDQAAVKGLKHWRFKPGAVAPMSKSSPGFEDQFADQDRLFKVPVKFVM